jgi:small GTP-binding protein
MLRSNGQQFPKKYDMTCGVDFSVKAVTVPDTEEAVEFHLFDTAGQDIFAEMMPSYWEGAKAVVLVYDVTRGHTLEACGMWYNRILEALGADSLPGVLVANKMDLRERTVIQRPQGQAFAANLNMPVSAARTPPARIHPA